MDKKKKRVRCDMGEGKMRMRSENRAQWNVTTLDFSLELFRISGVVARIGMGARVSEV
jgi:hypothetical protein